VRIVDVNEFYAEQGGGVRTYVNAKLRAAAERGHELVILAPGPENKRESRLGGEVIWLESPPMPLDPRYFVLYRQAPVHRWLDQLQPDVIEGSSPWTSGWFAARYPGRAKRVFIYHQDPVAVYSHTLFDRLLSVKTLDTASAPYWAYTRRLAKHFDATVVAGQWLAQRLEAHGIGNAVAVPFGIDRHLFSPDHSKPALRTELLARCGLGPDGRLLITISRHHPEKRVTTLIEAVGHLNRQGQEVGLVVFGDGPLRPLIERSARGVPRVHIAGFVADRPFIASALASADALIHGSAAETYGFAVAEALSSGTPVVVPDRGGAFDFAAPACSEVYRPGDARDCASAIARLLRRDATALRVASLTQARAHVGSQDDHFERLFALYSGLPTT
jgi:alpha-1,6-mannosyltransferase